MIIHNVCVCTQNALTCFRAVEQLTGADRPSAQVVCTQPVGASSRVDVPRCAAERVGVLGRLVSRPGEAAVEVHACDVGVGHDDRLAGVVAAGGGVVDAGGVVAGRALRPAPHARRDTVAEHLAEVEAVELREGAGAGGGVRRVDRPAGGIPGQPRRAPPPRVHVRPGGVPRQPVVEHPR